MDDLVPEAGFYSDFCQFLQRRFPLLQKHLEIQLSPNLISSHILHLPATVLEQCKNVVRGFHALRDSKCYRSHILSSESELLDFDPGNEAILMSFDFHLNEHRMPQLIEINTNASFALIAQSMRDFQRLAPFGGVSMVDRLKQSFESELQLSIGTNKPNTVAIVDEKPNTQRLYIEFLMFHDLFENFGWNPVIAGPEELNWNSQMLMAPDGSPVNLVYNRDNDFLLVGSDRQFIRNAYLAKQICLTPNPHEYLLLADKSRLVDVGQLDLSTILPSDLARSLSESVPQCLDLAQCSPDQVEDVWSRRKTLFFKPKRLYGSKAAFRGSSISRRAFDQAVAEGSIAQTFVPAPEIEIQIAGKPELMKYDLRFYVYRDEIQLVTARLYQGQVTNSHTPGGGFCSVVFD